MLDYIINVSFPYLLADLNLFSKVILFLYHLGCSYIMLVVTIDLIDKFKSIIKR